MAVLCEKGGDLVAARRPDRPEHAQAVGLGRNKAGLEIGADLTIAIVTTDEDAMFGRDEDIVLPPAGEHKKWRKRSLDHAELVGVPLTTEAALAVVPGARKDLGHGQLWLEKVVKLSKSR